MEDLKKSIENLEKKIDNNSDKIDNNVKEIINNMNKLHSHEEKISKNTERIQKNSYALDILKDYKKENKRLFTILVTILVLWFITAGYLVYILNDTGTIEETIEQETGSGNNNYIGNNGDISNGEANN